MRAAVGRQALQLARASYGAALVVAPGPAIRVATGRRPSRRACRVARVLGTRHLIQAALTAAAPGPAVLAIGGQVDAVHTASMLLLAAVSPAGRRAALTDALTEASFAAAGFSASTRLPGRALRICNLLPRFRRVWPGQWGGVSLPVAQQRVLEGIESALEGGEPRLRSMFAIFTRLTRDEGAPRTESLRAQPGLRRFWSADGLSATLWAVIAVPWSWAC
jgi:hypothetical protein